MKQIGRIILFPFSFLYGIAISARNVFYDIGLLRETSFSLPVINVGNLSMGGAGKTPHVEYLIIALQNYLNLAVLSRGYKRKTKGFRIVERGDSASKTGDEPLQFKRKFPRTAVAVAESRALGIPALIKAFPNIQTILLDDAFQHRSVKPFINILLTPYYDLYTSDMLLPAGRLRENSDAAVRADIIIVSKCPAELSMIDAQKIQDELNPLKHQKVFFSKYNYAQPYYIFDGRKKVPSLKGLNVILLSAIASTKYLMDYLEEMTDNINAMEYEDHHLFSSQDLDYLRKVYNNVDKKNTLIITTEKDAIRLQEHKEFIIENNLPIFALPVNVEILFDQKVAFDQLIKDSLLAFEV